MNYYHTTRNGCRILPGMYQRRTAVWEGRGATARPREAKWRSGVADVFGVYYNKNVFKDPFGHHYYSYYYRAALYNKDVSSTINIYSVLDVSYYLILLIIDMYIRKGTI